MNRKIGYLILAGLLALAPAAWAKGECHGKEYREKVKAEVKAHKARQKSENEAFQKQTKGMDLDTKYRAVVNHRETQYKENVHFRDKMHDRRMALLKDVYECRKAHQKERELKKQTRLDARTPSPTNDRI